MLLLLLTLFFCFLWQSHLLRMPQFSASVFIITPMAWLTTKHTFLYIGCHIGFWQKRAAINQHEMPSTLIPIIDGYRTGVINDPLGKTHSPASNNYNSHLRIVLFCGILKIGHGWTVRQTDNMFENSDHYRSGLCLASWINITQNEWWQMEKSS